jgi:hypothetical protein
MTRDTSSRGLATVIPEAKLHNKLVQEPALDRGVQARIGDQLRSMYDELMTQPVPDRFAELLGRLDGTGGAKTEGERSR